MPKPNSRPDSSPSPGGLPAPPHEAAQTSLPREEGVFEETVFPADSPSVDRTSAPPARGRARQPLGEGERLGEDDERGSSLALFEDGERGHAGFGSESRREESGGRERDGQSAIEVAEEASIRDFYSQLVTLLTQDTAARAPAKKSRAGLKEALRRRFWPALLLFLLTLGTLGALLRPKQATYASTVQLLLPPKTTQTSADPLASSDDAYDAPAQIAIIGSEDVVRDALKRVPANLKKRGFGDPDAEAAPVDVSPGASDQVINITVSSLDPEASLVTADAMVSAYTNYTRNRFSQNRDKNLRITRKSAGDADAQLAATEQRTRDLKERYGFLDLNSSQSNATNSIAGLKSALEAARRDAVGAEAKDSTLLALQDKVNQAQTAYGAVLRDFFPDSDRARAARAQLDAAQAQVSARRSEIQSTTQARIRQLEDSLRRAREGARNLPGIEQQMNQLNERAATLQTASRAAHERLNQLGLASQAVPPVATTLHSPGVSSTQTVQRARAFAVALLSALALATLGAWLLDRADRSVRTAPDPEVLFGAPVLGALPATNEHRTFYLAPTQSNKGNARARTQTIEACTNAQNNILAAATAVGARSVLLTSAMPEEGKSACASNLAAAMAYGGREVLLVDVDFWHPSQHLNFDMALSPGYSQVLRDKMPLSEAIRPTPVANLVLLSTGQDASTPGDVVGLLQNRAHRQNMELLKKYFDIIVIDAPPTMTVADAQLLSNLADAVVLVTAEKTRRDEVQRARSMLRLAGSYILGIIVNSVRPGEVGAWNLNFSSEEPFAEYSQYSANGRGRGRH